MRSHRAWSLFLRTCALIAVTKLANLSTLSVLVTAEDQPPAGKEPALPTTVPMICTVEGKPIAGAEIYLFQYNGELKRYQPFGPFSSDAAGKAVCQKVLFSNATGSFDRWFYARVPGQWIGVARSAQWKNQAAHNADGLIKMQTSTTVKGHVTVPPGFDCRNVTVFVQSMDILHGAKGFDFGESFPRQESFPGLDTALPRTFEVHPDASGQFKFDDMPIHGRLYLATKGEGLGQAQWWNQNKPFDELVELPIEVESSVSGRIVTPDGTPLEGLTVTARLMSQSFESSFHVVSDANGEFSIRGLPPVKMRLSIKDPNKKWAIRPLEELRIEVDENRKLNLVMETGIKVGGRAIDPDGKPVVGAGVSMITDGNRGAGLDESSTDQDGRYQFCVPSGGARLYFNSLPDGLTYPEPRSRDVTIKPGQPNIENLNFTLPWQPKPSTKTVDP